MLPTVLTARGSEDDSSLPRRLEKLLSEVDLTQNNIKFREILGHLINRLYYVNLVALLESHLLQGDGIRGADVTGTSFNNVIRHMNHIFMDENLLPPLGRIAWLMGRDLTLGLNGLSGWEPRQPHLEQLARSNYLQLATYECPGLLEPWALVASLGHFSMYAAAASLAPAVNEYRIHGLSRNRHTEDMDPSTLDSLRCERAELANALAFRTTGIDIPEEFFSIPQQVGIARGLYELGYRARGLDPDIIQGICSRNWAQEQRTEIAELVKHYNNYRFPSKDQTQALHDGLESILYDIGERALHAEGVYDVSDMFLQTLYYYYQNPRKHAPEPAIVTNGQEDFWAKIIFPSGLPAEVIKRIKDVPIPISSLGLPVQKHTIEYYLGEVIAMISSLYPDTIGPGDPPLQIKLGNIGESAWDNFVLHLLSEKDRQMLEDLVWLCLPMLPKGIDAQPGAFMSLLADKNVAYTKEGKPRTYVPYGVGAGNISIVPFLCQTQEELAEVLKHMPPLEIARLVSGTIAAYVFPGELNNEQDIRIAEKKRKALVAAAAYLPPAYLPTLELMLNRELSIIIDRKILFEAGQRVSVQTTANGQKAEIRTLDTHLIKQVDQELGQKIASLDGMIETQRRTILSEITQQIIDYFPGNHNISAKEVAVADIVMNILPERYKKTFNEHLATYQEQHKAEMPLDEQLEQVALYFFYLMYLTPEKRIDRDAGPMLEFIKKNFDQDSLPARDAYQAMQRNRVATKRLHRQVQKLYHRTGPIQEKDLEELLTGNRKAKTHLVDFLDDTFETLLAMAELQEVNNKEMLPRQIELLRVDILDYLFEFVGRTDVMRYMESRMKQAIACYEESVAFAAMVASENYSDAIDAVLKRQPQIKMTELSATKDYTGSHGLYELLIDALGIEPEEMDEFSRQFPSSRSYTAALWTRIGGMMPEYLQEELVLLGCLNEHFTSSEESYPPDTLSDEADEVRVLLLPEIMQHLSDRNRIADWIQTLRAAQNYLSNEPDALLGDANPTPQLAESIFAITPGMAAEFFTKLVDAHLEGELGRRWCSMQRNRYDALLLYNAIHKPGASKQEYTSALAAVERVIADPHITREPLDFLPFDFALMRFDILLFLDGSAAIKYAKEILKEASKRGEETTRLAIGRIYLQHGRHMNARGHFHYFIQNGSYRDEVAELMVAQECVRATSLSSSSLATYWGLRLARDYYTCAAAYPGNASAYAELAEHINGLLDHGAKRLSPEAAFSPPKKLRYELRHDVRQVMNALGEL